MKSTLKLLILYFFVIQLSACGGKEEKKEEFNYGRKAPVETPKEIKATTNDVSASKRIDLENCMKQWII